MYAVTEVNTEQIMSFDEFVRFAVYTCYCQIHAVFKCSHDVKTGSLGASLLLVAFAEKAFPSGSTNLRTSQGKKKTGQERGNA